MKGPPAGSCTGPCRARRGVSFPDACPSGKSPHQSPHVVMPLTTSASSFRSAARFATPGEIHPGKQQQKERHERNIGRRHDDLDGTRSPQGAPRCRWAAWFDGLTSPRQRRHTIITAVTDQARSMACSRNARPGLPLISVTYVEPASLSHHRDPVLSHPEKETTWPHLQTRPRKQRTIPDDLQRGDRCLSRASST